MAQNLRVSYVDFGKCGDGPVRFIPSRGGVQIDHCYAYIDDLGADHFSEATFNGTGFDQNSAHDNEIHLPRAADTGDGADGFQWSGSGFSIYHNTIVGYETGYTGSQHQDGVQTLGASHVKIYGNTIVNMANSAIFFDRPRRQRVAEERRVGHRRVCVLRSQLHAEQRRGRRGSGRRAGSAVRRQSRRVVRLRLLHRGRRRGRERRARVPVRRCARGEPAPAPAGRTFPLRVTAAVPARARRGCGARRAAPVRPAEASRRQSRPFQRRRPPQPTFSATRS